jgi:hypothetical protein
MLLVVIVQNIGNMDDNYDTFINSIQEVDNKENNVELDAFDQLRTLNIIIGRVNDIFKKYELDCTIWHNTYKEFISYCILNVIDNKIQYATEFIDSKSNDTIQIRRVYEELKCFFRYKCNISIPEYDKFKTINYTDIDTSHVVYISF